MRRKVAAVFEIPTPYRQPVLEILSRRQDHQIDFFFLSKSQKDRHWDESLFRDLSSTYLPGRQICFYGHHTVHFNCEVKKQLISQNYDAFVLNGYAQPALWKLLRHSWKTEKPYVMITESHLQKRRSSLVRKLKDSYVRRVYKKSGANLVMGSMAKEYVQFYGANPELTFFFPNTIDGPSFAQEVDQRKSQKELLKAKLGLEGKQIILFVGTLQKRKGVDLLLEAFRRLSADHPNTALLLAGTGPLKEVGLHDRICFTGFVQPSDLATYYAIADIFAMPSRQEPFGAVVCEAAAAGLPVITTDIVGAAVDFVQDEKSGYLIPSENVEILEKRLRTLCSGPELRASMGAKGRAIMMKWTHELLADHFLQAVESACRNR